MDPTLEAQLMAYFASEPVFAQEFQRVQGAGDSRTPAEWMYDHIQVSPGDQAKFSQFVAVDAGGVEGGPPPDGSEYTSGDIPLEQALLEITTPRVLADIEADAGRSELAGALQAQLQGDYAAARNALSPEESARRLAEEYAMADTNAARISESAATSAEEQLGVLQAAIAAMQGNLQGELGARAAALQQQISALTANLDQFDAAQREALAQQIVEQGQNLEASIAAQREALGVELEALRGAATGRTQAQQATLEAELASLQGLNTEEANARRAALQQEIALLRSASSEQGVARRAALEAEIAGLTAAQEPLNQARLQTAESLATGINLALEGERDRLTAANARRGYLGGSSFEDAALARAAIGARQNAATVLGQAREANAGDMRTIGARSATEGRSLADALARENFDISGREATEGRNLADWIAGRNTELGAYGAAGRRSILDQGAQAEFDIASRGATGQRSLSDALATGRRGIADYGTDSRAAISGNTAQTRFSIGNAGAERQFQDSIFGAEQQRSLADALARGGGEIGTNRILQQQAARDQATALRQSYFDNAYTRQQGGILARPGLTGDLTRNLTAAADYGNSGLNRALGTLNWWSGGGQAPTPGITPVQPSTTGSDIAGLGAGLTSAALSFANANNWWQQPTGTYKGMPVVNTPSTATATPNWWQSNTPI